MSSATDVQHYADSASKGSVRPVTSNTGIAAQNSGSWMLDLVSQHIKCKPAISGKDPQQGNGVQMASGSSGLLNTPVTVQQLQAATALPAQGPPKKKRGRPVGSRNKGPSKKRQTTQEADTTQLPQAQQPAMQPGLPAAATTAVFLPQETAQEPIVEPQADAGAQPTELGRGTFTAAVQAQPVAELPAPADGEPRASSLQATSPVTVTDVGKEDDSGQGKLAEETVGTKRRSRPPKPKLDL